MSHYVLARKYRPKSFSELKGQEALVTTLSNAIKLYKLAHAYLLIGTHGIGKTTTARIIAKTINCTNLPQDSLTPCESCENCKAIQDENHIDITEFDAASKTSVNDIREVIEGAGFKPLLGKYKIYIIDEVHMLSGSAFNALLKTLEEPPQHLIFIFATTEIRKIPSTVISRCQVFNLHRFTDSTLTSHLKEISDKENIECSEDGLSLIAEFSEGSVRDALSLLQTASLYSSNKRVDAALVTHILGLPDFKQLCSLLGYLMNGEAHTALKILNELYNSGVQPNTILESILKYSNKIAKILVENNRASTERTELLELANKTDIGNITTLWKIAYKSIEELKYTDNSINTLEMLVIRICYLSKQPSISEAINRLLDPRLRVDESGTVNERALPETFQELIKLFYTNKELVLYHQLLEEVRLVNYKPGLIEAKISQDLPKDFAQQVLQRLKSWTSIEWQFILRDSALGALSIKENELEEAKSDSLVQDVLKSFPGARIKNIVKT